MRLHPGRRHNFGAAFGGDRKDFDIFDSERARYVFKCQLVTRLISARCRRLRVESEAQTAILAIRQQHNGFASSAACE